MTSLVAVPVVVSFCATARVVLVTTPGVVSSQMTGESCTA